MKIEAYKAVFFDLDGTLIDTAKDLSFAIDIMCAELVLPQPSLPQVKHWIGNGTAKLVARTLIYATNCQPTDNDLKHAFTIFSDAYIECLGEHSTLFSGSKELLVKLLSNNIKLACITNKPKEFTEFLLMQNMILQFFSVICAGDNVKFKKPHAWPLTHASKKLKVNLQDCLMIGDSTLDVSAARNAGCDVWAVNYGYNQGNNIQDANPDKIINSFDELL
ncbi:MAG: phosphoglycolate phosphatase [Proteobacteria bacterium]|nr:phosphoglycolate phosphatase [Pseudomonadota bacterium]